MSSKNTTVNIPLYTTPGTSGANVYRAVVSSGGPDKGKILEVTQLQQNGVDVTKPLLYSEANAVYQQNKSDWDFRINRVLTSNSVNLPGLAPTVTGLSDDKLFDQTAKQNLSSSQNNQTSFTSTLGQEIAAQAASPRPPSTASKIYVFPRDISIGKDESTQDYIRIAALKYTAPQSGFLEFVPLRDPSVGTILKSGLASFNRNVPKNLSFEGELILPMPLSITDGAKAEWGVSNMNVIGAAMVGNLQGIYENLPGLGDALEASAALGAGANLQALGSLAKVVGQAKLSSPEAAQIIRSDVISSVISRIGQNVPPADILTRFTGKAVNPNAELLFRAPSLRIFDLNWKLVPRSSYEASTIRKMIRFLKINMLPSIPVGSAVLLQSPNVFVIRYERSDGSQNPSLPKPKICALTQVQADHTSDGVGWAAYEDSHPVSTTLRMSFAELTPVLANDYAGTSEDDVGI
jgi:hypothetical protein